MDVVHDLLVLCVCSMMSCMSCLSQGVTSWSSDLFFYLLVRDLVLLKFCLAKSVGIRVVWVAFSCSDATWCLVVKQSYCNQNRSLGLSEKAKCSSVVDLQWRIVTQRAPIGAKNANNEKTSSELTSFALFWIPQKIIHLQMNYDHNINDDNETQLLFGLTKLKNSSYSSSGIFSVSLKRNHRSE